jgi:hypothetical protein
MLKQKKNSCQNKFRGADNSSSFPSSFTTLWQPNTEEEKLKKITITQHPTW